MPQITSAEFQPRGKLSQQEKRRRNRAHVREVNVSAATDPTFRWLQPKSEEQAQQGHGDAVWEAVAMVVNVMQGAAGGDPALSCLVRMSVLFEHDHVERTVPRPTGHVF